MKLLGDDPSPDSFDHWLLDEQYLRDEEFLDFSGFLDFITTLHEQGATWEFRHTLTYIAAVTCLVGSLMFTLGSFFWLFNDSFTGGSTRSTMVA